MNDLSLGQVGRHAQRRLLRALGAMSPRVAAELALARFLTPPGRGFGWGGEVVSEGPHARGPSGAGTAADVRFRGGSLSVGRWGSGPGVLLVHGWGASRNHFRHFVPSLLAGGMSVVAFDAPAHGASEGKRLDAMVFTGAIRRVWQECGPFRAAAGHSFGAACLLLAVARFDLPVERLVSIAAPWSLLWLTQDFARRQGLTAPVARALEGLLEQRTGLPWPEASLESALQILDVPTLFVHDELDPVVPFVHCDRLARRARRPSRLTTRGRGHAGLLTDAGVIAELSAFLRAAGPP